MSLLGCCFSKKFQTQQAPKFWGRCTHSRSRLQIPPFPPRQTRSQNCLCKSNALHGGRGEGSRLPKKVGHLSNECCFQGPPFVRGGEPGLWTRYLHLFILRVKRLLSKALTSEHKCADLHRPFSNLRQKQLIASTQRIKSEVCFPLAFPHPPFTAPPRHRCPSEAVASKPGLIQQRRLAGAAQKLRLPF